MKQDKKVAVMGLTKDQWTIVNEILAKANKEQIEKIILLAADKLEDKRVAIINKEDDVGGEADESN